MPHESLDHLSERTDNLTQSCKKVIHRAAEHHKTIEQSVNRHTLQIERTFDLVDRTNRLLEKARSRKM